MVFKYMAIVDEGEEYDEMGIVVARGERTAREKLRERFHSAVLPVGGKPMSIVLR